MDFMFYSCDWGTTSFRLRAVRIRDLMVLGEVETDQGVRNLFLESGGMKGEFKDRSGLFQRVLVKQIKDLMCECPSALPDASIYISGMASSNIGWHDLPYASCPMRLDPQDLVFRMDTIQTNMNESADVVVISGLKTESDVMRGEETEILGLVSSIDPADREDGCLLILPGTHSKHVFIRNNQIMDFRTFISGELFEVLCRHSILAGSIQWPLGRWQDLPEQRDELIDGMEIAWREGVVSALFKVRALDILKQKKSECLPWLLYGMIIGSELRAIDNLWPEIPVYLCATRKFSSLYSLALRTWDSSQRFKSVLLPEVVELASLVGHSTPAILLNDVQFIRL